MSLTALLDVSVLVALFDPEHVHHEAAHDWFAEEGRAAWATCPLTEAGFLRVLSNPSSRGTLTRPAELAARLQRFCRSGGHTFWPADLSPLEDSVFDLSVIACHRQLTDILLLGLAHARGGRLVTFDRTIPHRAVKHATPESIAVIAPVD